MYFTLALCLFSHLPYRDVLRGVPGAPGAAVTALTGLRRRLGPRPLQLLFEKVAGTLSAGREPWSHACGLLLAAWDGTTLKLPASEENKAWARGTGRGGHYPRARLVALAACGTRGLIAAAAGPWATGERALAATLTGHLNKGMLLLADRGFYSWGLWHAAAGTGAHLLWRVQGNLHLPVVRPLPDGSWLSRIDDPYQKKLRDTRTRKRKNRPANRARRPEPGRLPGTAAVRVIEFTVTAAGDDGTVRTGRYRMITTLLDHRAAPAAELAAAYARRWAVETCFAELKTRLRGPGRVLRSRTPDLALQEIWAYLAVYQAIRAVIARTAAGRRLDPARLSFTAALASAETALLAAPVPERPGRVRPRAVREPGPAYPRTSDNDPLPHHATYTLTINAAPAPPGNQPSQHKSAKSQPQPPP